MTISLISLPYSADALRPHVSRRTLELHHGKHHKDYVDKTNAAIAGTELDRADLNDIVQRAAESGDAKLFNPASQAWNHGFYWSSLAPDRTAPGDALALAIDRDFGSLDALRKALKKVSADHFGSGWGWLVAADDKLSVVSSNDAHSPFSDNSAKPLLTVDVWEHAYYLDVQNERAAYLDAVIDNCLNWAFATENFERREPWRYPANEDQAAYSVATTHG